MKVRRWVLAMAGIMAGAFGVVAALFRRGKTQQGAAEGEPSSSRRYQSSKDAPLQHGANENLELLKDDGLSVSRQAAASSSGGAGPSSVPGPHAGDSEHMHLLHQQGITKQETLLKRQRADSGPAPIAASNEQGTSAGSILVQILDGDGTKGSSPDQFPTAPQLSPAQQPSKKPKVQDLAHDAVQTAEPGPSVDHAGPDAMQADSAHAARASVVVLPRPTEEPKQPVDVNYLQGLLDAELGPPKFATPKPDAHLAHHLPGDSRGSGSLQDLLDKEFGPPKFVVPKQPAVQAPPEKPRLQLYVLSGPATGQTIDSTNPGQELRIGRYPDSTLALPDDAEVSGRHAIIAYVRADAAWKLTDVGSLNGTQLNGETISTDNREPGAAHVLHDGDIIAFGTVTRVRVTVCVTDPAGRTRAYHTVSGPVPREGEAGPSTSRATPSGTAAANSHHGNVAGPVGALAQRGGGGGGGAGSPLTTTGHPGASATIGHAPSAAVAQRSSLLQITHPLGPHLALQPLPALGAGSFLAVHQKLGADHKRMEQGCEDVVYWEVPFTPGAPTAAFAIFDGHHGVNAADKAKAIMPDALRAKLAQAGGDGAAPVLGRPLDAQKAMLRELFLEVDAQIALDEGCTATLVLAQRDDTDKSLVLQAANVGDSSAVLVLIPAPLPTGAAASDNSGPRAGLPSAAGPRAPVPDPTDSLLWKPVLNTAGAPAAGPGGANGGGAESSGFGGGARWIKLTADHRIANSANERQRLEERGHTVKNRLYGLNISRMLGDKFLKDEDLGFIAEPHVSGIARVPSGCRAFLLIASDGLWDVVQEGRAAGLVAKAVEEDSVGLGAADVADMLLNQALALRSKDDVSVIAVELRP